MGLRIDVDKEDAFAGLGQGRPEIDGRRRLSDAAFLVHQCDDSHSTSVSKQESVGDSGAEYKGSGVRGQE